MVYGLNTFIEAFREFTGHYVVIGGTACDLLFDEMGLSFRATRDVDMVLIVEEVNAAFGQAFWGFVHAGDYRHVSGSGDKPQFYRFTHPSQAGYPAMLELFSRKPFEMTLSPTQVVVPLHIDDEVSSLSAIVLDDMYYQTLQEGRTTVAGCSVLRLEYLILFKIKAWLNLAELRDRGEEISSRTISKHKHDVLRMLVNVQPGLFVPVERGVQASVVDFSNRIEREGVDLKSIGIREIPFDRMMEQLLRMYPVRG